MPIVFRQNLKIIAVLAKNGVHFSPKLIKKIFLARNERFNKKIPLSIAQY